MRKRLLLAAAIALTACSDPAARITTAPPQAVAEPLFGTLYSNIRETRRMVIRDEATWSALWAEMVGSASGTAPPRIDFAREDVLIAAMGERHVAGYEIAIAGVSEAGGSLRADVVSKVPGGACSAADVITTPLDAVRVPRSSRPVQFTESTIVQSCP